MIRQCLLIAMALCAVAAYAAEPDAQQRASVITILKDMERATNTRDVATLLKHASSDIVMVSKNGEIVVGRKAVADYLNRMIGAVPALKELKSTMREPRITLAAPDTLIVDGRTDDYYAFSSGMDFSITTTWSATLVPQEGAWRIAVLHFGFNLFDNPLLSGAQRMVYWLAAMALLLGALLGVLAGVLENRLKTMD